MSAAGSPRLALGGTIARTSATSLGGTARRHWPLLLIAGVVLIDQAAKWIAGHAGPGAYIINAGAAWIWPTIVTKAALSPILGAIVNAVGAVALAGVVLLARRSRGMLAAGLAMIAAGGIGNSLDRLGLSFITAPLAHPRGAVDLAALNYANLADWAVSIGLCACTGAAIWRSGALQTLAAWTLGHRPAHTAAYGIATATVTLGLALGAVGYGQQSMDSTEHSQLADLRTPAGRLALLTGPYSTIIPAYRHAGIATPRERSVCVDESSTSFATCLTAPIDTRGHIADPGLPHPPAPLLPLAQETYQLRIAVTQLEATERSLNRDAASVVAARETPLVREVRALRQRLLAQRSR